MSTSYFIQGREMRMKMGRFGTSELSYVRRQGCPFDFCVVTMHRSASVIRQPVQFVAPCFSTVPHYEKVLDGGATQPSRKMTSGLTEVPLLNVRIHPARAFRPPPICDVWLGRACLLRALCGGTIRRVLLQLKKPIGKAGA